MISLNYLLEMFCVSLLLTFVIELAIGYIWGFRSKIQIYLVGVVNLLTNPAAVFLIWLGRCYFHPYIAKMWEIIVEILVIIIEATLYCIFIKKKAWKISKPICFTIFVNMFSWFMGMIFQTIR